MLSRNQRLNLRYSFSKVRAGAKKETPSLRCFYIFIKEQEQPLIGVALSSKNFKKAHDRNQVKRGVYQAVAEIYSTLPKELNLVIMPKSEALNRSVGELKKELEDAKITN